MMRSWVSRRKRSKGWGRTKPLLTQPEALRNLGQCQRQSSKAPDGECLIVSQKISHTDVQ